MEEKTHRDAATLFANSDQSVVIRLHRPYDSEWLEPSRKTLFKADRRGIVREESSTAIFLEGQSLSLSQSGAPVDLSAIREVTEFPSLLDCPQLSNTPPDENEEDDGSWDLPESVSNFPILPKEGPPSDESSESLTYSNHEETLSKRASLLLNIPVQNDILSSISEPCLSPGDPTEGSGLTEVCSELLLMGGEAEEEGSFTVTLKKGFRGLGFSLDGDLSEQKGKLSINLAIATHSW